MSATVVLLAAEGQRWSAGVKPQIDADASSRVATPIGAEPQNPDKCHIVVHLRARGRITPRGFVPCVTAVTRLLIAAGSYGVDAAFVSLESNACLACF
jgi:hypothetical protein